MLVIFSNIFVVFAIAGVGLGANKLGTLPSECNQYLIKLLMNIATPCLLIASISSKELTEETFNLTITMLAGSILAMFFVMAVSHLVTIALKVPKVQRGAYNGIMTLMNNGFIGYPVTLAAFGEEGLYLMVLCNMILGIFNFTVGFFEVNIGTGKFGVEALRRNFKSMLNPCAVCSLIGILLLFMGWQLPPILFSLVEKIGEISIPLSMLVVGVQLGDSNLRQVITNHKLVAASLMKLVGAPLVIFLAVYWMPLPDMAKLILVFSQCFPTAVGLVTVAALEDCHPTLCSEGVALTTVGSMATLPLAVLVLTAIFL